MLTAKITQKEFARQVEDRLLGLIEEIGIEPDKKLRKRLGKKAKKIGQKLYEKVAKKFSAAPIPPVGEQMADAVDHAITPAALPESAENSANETPSAINKPKRSANGRFKK